MKRATAAAPHGRFRQAGRGGGEIHALKCWSCLENDDPLRFVELFAPRSQWRTLTVSAHEFIRRFIQHVLPKAFQRVRYYGWLAPAAQARWQRILALLDWKAPALVLAPKAQPLCPQCGRRLCWIATFKPP